MTDESWPMIEEAVFRLFDEIAADYTVMGPRLAALGWSDIEAEYPVPASEVLFRAQGTALAHTDCLNRVMLAELAGVLDEPVDAVVLPAVADGCVPGMGRDWVSGMLAGPVPARLVVAVSGPTGAVSVGVVAAEQLATRPLDTFDPSVAWSAVSGASTAELVEATTAWSQAVSAAHRGLATELVALTEQMLRLAVEHASARVQFGAPIGSFQSPRHALAEAAATLAGARALVGQAWRYGEPVTARTAKAAAGRAHRVVAGTAMQVCAAIGLSAEHDLHRYIRRGFQLDALLGSHQYLEAQLADQLFDTHTPGQGLPALVVCG